MEKQNKTNFVIRDLRQKSRYTIDDEYLNGYAKLCGVFGTAVYNSLCRHASKHQECFPSIELIAEQHNIGRKSVMNGLKNLKTWGIVEIIRERDTKTKRLKNNVYILLDKSQWKPKPSTSHLLGSKKDDLVNDKKSVYPSKPQILGNQELSPCEGHRAKSLSGTDPGPSQDKSQVPVGDYKDTHIKETHNKDIVESPNGSSTSSLESSEKGEREKREMNLSQFVEWCSKSKQSHVRIIGEWAETVKPELQTVGQWEAYMKRHLRPARALVPFSREQLENGFEKIREAQKKGWLTMITLETLLKFITN